MLKKTITYTDYNGNSRTEDFYFNLTKTELMKMEMGTNGGLSEMVKSIIAAQDQAALIQIFEDLILKAYGVKSLDGKRFEKSAQLSEAFAQTEAYDQLFMELATDDKAAIAFINGIIPDSMRDRVVEDGSNVSDLAPANQKTVGGSYAIY